MSMKYKNLIQDQSEAVLNQLSNLISALETNKISKEDSLVMLNRIKGRMELIQETISLEEQNFFTSDRKS